MAIRIGFPTSETRRGGWMAGLGMALWYVADLELIPAPWSGMLRAAAGLLGGGGVSGVIHGGLLARHRAAAGK